MNSKRVVIKNAFGSLKNRGRILKHFNLKVDRVARVVVACCNLHNYYLKWGAHELGPPNVAILQNNLQGFGDRLPILRKGEKLKIALFEQWLIDTPNQE
jgi:hypothetical protein